MTTPTAALVEEAQSMTTDTLIEEAMGEMHRLGIDNLRAKGAIVLLVESLRRAEAERDEARCDAEAVRAAASYLTEKTQQMAHLRASVVGQQKRAEQAEAELDAATTQLAKKFKRLEELERRCTQAESDRDELRATVTRLNRRAQTAEAGVRDNVEASKAAGVSMGRTLANAAAAMNLRRAEKAEAERDAQHAEVLRLTGELEAAREQLERIANPPIKRLHVENGEMDIVLDAPEMASIIATVFYDALDEHKAENYLEMTCAKPESPQKRVVITVRKVLGKTPDEMRKKAERELAEARAHIATLEMLRRGGK